MKLQHLAIIFVIIILPISMVISSYIQTQIDTISLQTTYNSKLQTATYDAIKAFQLNTLNNKYSSISDSKIRDIEASISTFYNSLGTELGASGYDRESLQQFIPAVVYTMYDGYYIYGKYYNNMINSYQYGLGPYIYYSCRYVDNDKGHNFVVNYTLDNSITIYGKVNGQYVTKSGTLINLDSMQGNNITEATNIQELKSIIYSGITIEPEILSEQLIILNDSGNPEQEPSPKKYEYTVYNNQKKYIEEISEEDSHKDNQNFIYENNNRYFRYFRYVNNQKLYITNSSDNKEETDFLKYWTTNDGHLQCNSAIEYYAKAYKFSKWVNDNLSEINQEEHAKDVNEKEKNIDDFAIKTGKKSIFKLNNDNDPMLDSSTFNQNRISVIRRTLQTRLNTAIANYSSSASYDFTMPVFTEEDWDKLVNNISVASFMQGIPIGAKYYNNYCIITNNKNKEVVTKDSIYIISNNGEAHRAASKDVIDNKKTVIGAYRNVDFEPQTVVGNENYTYYPHANDRCYECLVSVAETYSIDDIISGTIKNYDKNADTYVKNDKATTNLKEIGLRKIYLTALARERQNLYKTNDYFGT